MAGFLANFSNVVIPVIIFYIVAYGLINKVQVYEEFIGGAKEGLKTVVGILPTLVGLMVGVGVLRASGFMGFLGGLLGRFTEKIGIPADIVPLTLVKMFSSSAATGLVLDIFKTHGTDSYIGMLTSILMSCTDTMLILRGNEEYLQRQDLEFVLIKRVCPLCTLSPVVLDRQS